MERKRLDDCVHLVRFYSGACCGLFCGAGESDSVATACWGRTDVNSVAGGAVVAERDFYCRVVLISSVRDNLTAFAEAPASESGRHRSKPRWPPDGGHLDKTRVKSRQS